MITPVLDSNNSFTITQDLVGKDITLVPYNWGWIFTVQPEQVGSVIIVPTVG